MVGLVSQGFRSPVSHLCCCKTLPTWQMPLVLSLSHCCLHRRAAWCEQVSNQKPLLETGTDHKAGQGRLPTHGWNGLRSIHPSIPPSIHCCQPYPLALVRYSPFGCTPFKTVPWPCRDNWRERKSKAGTCLTVTARNLCSAFSSRSSPCRLLASGGVPPLLNTALQMVPPAPLQLALLSFLWWARSSTDAPSSRLLACWLCRLPALQRWAWPTRPRSA